MHGVDLLHTNLMLPATHLSQQSALMGSQELRFIAQS